jgi:hypothetical protein
LDTNSGSPLGAICSTIAEAFDFGRDKALRFDTFFLGRLADFAGVALTFFGAADFLAFFGLATLRAFVVGFLDFLRFPLAAISQPPNDAQGIYGDSISELSENCLIRDHARELSDISRPSAFWRIAPTLRFSCFAIFGAGVFWRASDFSTRISSFDQNQRLFFCIINP